MFHENTRFADLKSAYLALMCLFAADEYQSNFIETKEIPFGTVYFTLYGAVILIIVANVIVFLIESGYEKEIRDSKRRKQAYILKHAKQQEQSKMRRLLVDGVTKKLIKE